MRFSGVKYLTLLALIYRHIEKLVKAEFQPVRGEKIVLINTPKRAT